MMRKMLALVMVLAVVLSSLTFVTTFADDASAYEPKELMLQTAVDPSAGAMMALSWRNPITSALDDVKLYDITSGADTLLADKSLFIGGYKNSITDDAPVLRNGRGVVQYVLKGLTKGTYYKYKLVFSFNDGTDAKTYFLSGAPEQISANGQVNLTENLFTYNGRAAGYPYPPVFAQTVTENDGNTALKLTSNIGAYVSNNWSQIRYKVTGLTSGKTYKVGFRYKSETGSKPKFSILESSSKCATDIPVTNDTLNYREWTDFSVSKYTAGAATAYVRINFDNPIEYLIVDDFYVREIIDENTLGDNLITDGGLDTLKTYKTLVDAEPDGTPGDGTATVSWENDDNASYYKFYKDGGLFGIFYPDPSGTTSVNVAGLENGTEYTFGVEPFSKNFTPNTVKTVTVTPKEAEESAPENHMISNLSVNPYTFGGTGGAATVSFKNPKVSDITSVELYDENGAKLTDTAFALTSGALNVYTIKNLENGTVYKYKLQVTTASSGLTEYDIAVKPIAGAYSLNFNTDGTNHYWSKAFNRANSDTPFPPIDFRIVQNPDSDSDDYVLGVVSNMQAYKAGSYANLLYKFTDQLDTSASYRLKFKYKTLADGSRPVVYLNNKELLKIDLNSDGWQTATADFTGNNASTNELKFSFNNPLEGIYLDKVEIVPVTDGTEGANILTNGDFDFVANDTSALTVDSVTTNAYDSSADINYSLSDTCKMVKIYEKNEYGLNLVSVEQGVSKSGKISLNALKNSKEYTFVMTAVNAKDVEGAGYEFTVTPVPDPIVISDYILTKNGSAVENISEGTHTASISIKNNNGGSNYTAQLIAAIYDGKKLYDVKASAKTVIPVTDENGTATVLTAENIVIPALDGGDYTLKLMLWSGLDEMVPLKPFAPYSK